jgi:hypothetical protein
VSRGCRWCPRVQMRAGEIQTRVAEDERAQGGRRVQLRPEHAHRLRVGAPVQAQLERAHEVADVVDESPTAPPRRGRPARGAVRSTGPTRRAHRSPPTAPWRTRGAA